MRTFPDDLAQAQRDWSATYRLLAEQPGRTALRGRLHRLSARAWFHPCWRDRRPSPAAWRDLRELGRADGDGREANRP
ncbi:hypothetical protein SZN_26054 [Streptomyces zinciresistens K42]|uniref:Uncharacterized protein n=1 Tax=Streptomyces zinciresistens K42 TaxID=700597 RepID=G2GI71_9ACTN|nr:hypothetical protein [Streptomyces zinciresistens]EGX56803.1 hypothetical protein SZN_26054 [Streptomyces zinciresistens K42]